MFGWAKPVPYNPYNLRNQKLGPALVGVAGPVSNIAIAIVFGLLVRFSDVLALPGAFIEIVLLIVFLNLILAVFNLVPIPPLDGSKVLFAVLPAGSLEAQAFLERYGIILLLVFIFFFSWIIVPVVATFLQIITGYTWGQALIAISRFL
jgi:Zn-dependent protease